MTDTVLCLCRPVSVLTTEAASFKKTSRQCLSVCLSVYTGTGIEIDSVMRPRSSSRGAIQVPQLQLVTVTYSAPLPVALGIQDAGLWWSQRNAGGGRRYLTC